MGFRSTFTTWDDSLEWPAWFRDKYKHQIWFSPDGTGPLSSRFEAKTYGELAELHTDIQKAIDWSDDTPMFVLVYLHECGGITRCQIERDAIRWTEPTGWRASDGVEHLYCSGCSDAGLAGRVGT